MDYIKTEKDRREQKAWEGKMLCRAFCVAFLTMVSGIFCYMTEASDSASFLSSASIVMFFFWGFFGIVHLMDGGSGL